MLKLFVAGMLLSVYYFVLQPLPLLPVLMRCLCFMVQLMSGRENRRAKVALEGRNSAKFATRMLLRNGSLCHSSFGKEKQKLTVDRTP